MSARESGATMTQSTGEPELEGRSEGANGDARRGSGTRRGAFGGSAAAPAASPAMATSEASATGNFAAARRTLESSLSFWMEVSDYKCVATAAPGHAVVLRVR